MTTEKKIWRKFRMAGLECNFRKSDTKLPMRISEGCSLSRGKSSNRHNISVFYKTLQDIYSRTSSFTDGSRIFNLDETGTEVVQNFRIC